MDRNESDWKRRIHAEAEAQQRPSTVREYFAPQNSNLPVLRREIISVMDVWRKQRVHRTWWWRALRRLQHPFGARPVVVVVQAPPGDNGERPSTLVQP